MRVILAAAIIAIATVGIAGRQQSTDDVAVTLPVAGSDNATGVLRLPAAARPPAVLLITDTSTGALAAALAAEGVASLRVDARSIDLMAQWISYLRNDGRFPLVTVFADGDLLAVGVIAGRAGRADGIVTRGDTTAAAAELSRVVATLKSIEATVTVDAARQIAAIARSVPALGRRGTSATRTVARRSLRHTVMQSIDGVRVAIEWGQPQMRGRNIWGELVPWGEVWMPGADEATVLTTDGPLKLGDIDVPAGDHTIYTLPTADRVQLLISRDVGQFHTVHDASLVIGRTDMKLNAKADSTEGLTFTLQPAGDNHSGTLTLSWDKREYVVAVRSR